jgi:hypothetical protein
MMCLPPLRLSPRPVVLFDSAVVAEDHRLSLAALPHQFFIGDPPKVHALVPRGADETTVPDGLKPAPSLADTEPFVDNEFQCDTVDGLVESPMVVPPAVDASRRRSP